MLIHLSPRSQESLHRQVSRQIRRLILAGDLAPGAGLDSIRGLAKTHAISVITVRRAYEDLEREGLIFSRHGKGWFVAELPSGSKQDLITRRLAKQLRPILAQALEEGMGADDLQAFVADQIRDLGAGR